MIDMKAGKKIGAPANAIADSCFGLLILGLVNATYTCTTLRCNILMTITPKPSNKGHITCILNFRHNCESKILTLNSFWKLEVSFSVGRHMATVQLSHAVASQLQNNFSDCMRSMM